MNTESQHIEFKQKWNDEYLKWICAFANTDGGTLYIGVKDNGDICGLPNIHQLSEDIPNKILHSMGLNSRLIVVATEDSVKYGSEDSQKKSTINQDKVKLIDKLIVKAQIIGIKLTEKHWCRPLWLLANYQPK